MMDVEHLAQCLAELKKKANCFYYCYYYYAIINISRTPQPLAFRIKTGCLDFSTQLCQLT